jgi:hypothetical protein
MFTSHWLASFLVLNVRERRAESRPSPGGRQSAWYVVPMLVAARPNMARHQPSMVRILVERVPLAFAARRGTAVSRFFLLNRSCLQTKTLQNTLAPVAQLDRAADF